MEFSRQEYPALAAILKPNEAINVVNERLRVINKAHQEVADWFLERRKIEDAYTLGLRRLARRPQPDAAATLGVFELPWQRLVAATESLAQSHETLAHEIEVDVERPLREYSLKNREAKTMTNMQNDLMNLAKSLEAAQKKADKLKDKKSRGSAKSSANAAVEDARTQWESRAPFVFEKLQAVDEHRLNHLRDVLTQLQTHESDQVERSRQSAESCLNALLNVDTSEEINTFALKASGGRTAEPATRTTTAATTTTETPAATEPPATRETTATETTAATTNHDRSAPSSPPATAESLPPPPRIHDDAASRRSSGSNQPRPTVAEPRHSAFGLKRLGTVMNRRKSIVQPPAGHSAPPERKFRSPFSFRRTESARNFHQVGDQPTTGNALAPVNFHDEPSQQRPKSGNPEAEGERRAESRQHGGKPLGDVIPEEAPVNDTPLATTQSHETKDAPPKEQLDAEGFSAKPDTVDEITRIQREAAASEESGINLTIREKPIQEDEGEAKNALNEMASTLRLQAQHSGLSRGTGTLRGRRDVRNTIFIPSPPPPTGNEPNDGVSPGISSTSVDRPISPDQQARNVSPPVPGVEDHHTISDIASVHSSHTLQSLSGTIAHPILTDGGLNASIAEKLHVLVSQGKVAASTVVGEVALAYNPQDEPQPEKQLIRLDNFPLLERIACNHSLVTEAALPRPDDASEPQDDKKKEYDLSVNALKGPAPVVAFRYQIHLDASNMSAYCPVIFTPIWNEEELQASVIIDYSLNPEFMSSAPLGSIVLKNLVLSVGLDISSVDEETKQPREVVRATGAVMYPNTGAAFRRKHSAVSWKIPELEVKSEGNNRFLARFSTAASWPRKGKVDAKFEIVTPDSQLRVGVSAYTGSQNKSADPFADETNGNVAGEVTKSSSEAWKEIATQRKLSVQRYTAS